LGIKLTQATSCICTSTVPICRAFSMLGKVHITIFISLWFIAGYLDEIPLR
jgi:hypothetical protein